MGALDYIRRKLQVDTIENRADEYIAEKVGSLAIPDKLKEDNAFQLATTVSEIYFPIDYMADRASKLRYYITDKNGVEIPESSELNRFLTKINPFYSFSDLMYQALFSYLSDGNLYHYLSVPQSYRNVSVNNITRLDILQPPQVSIREYNNVSELLVTDVTDFIKDARYYSGTSQRYDQLRTDRLKLYRFDSTRRSDSSILAKSPLFKAVRNINNLLATYSARYNVYVNNGAAGYLVKKSANGGIEASLTDRKDIVDQINDRNGLTGNRRMWGISSVPLEWINTLSTIKDLMPYEETLENTIKIAGVFQIPPELVPRKDQSTFENKATSERTVWENALMSLIDTMCNYFTRSFTLDQSGYKILADYSSVSALNVNETEIEAQITAKLQNLEKLKAMGYNVDNEITKILQSYEARK